MQMRPIVLSSLLMVATPYTQVGSGMLQNKPCCGDFSTPPVRLPRVLHLLGVQVLSRERERERERKRERARERESERERER